MKKSDDGFTLIELLVVIAIVAILLSILLPGLNKCKELTKKLTCQSNLKQIMIGWFLYFNDNDDAFPRRVNINHDFGGWEGTGGGNQNRLLNSYLNLEPVIKEESQKTVFYCPADRGGVLGRPESQRAYNHYGNSYQTNLFIIGSTLLQPTNDLHIALNEKYQQHDILRLPHITVAHYKLLFLGDNNWMDQVDPIVPDGGKDWHKKMSYFNMSFLDGHVDFICIPKDTYYNENFTTLPFIDISLDNMEF
jgi:prepilin-type N-terminal cleavage/methylation domain-containing protein/prepilin-type processing-associated H-X9-DG protein